MSSSPRVFNVLILGETGVGKTTFLNALLNYFTYNSLSEIKNPEYFTPTSFRLLNKDFVEETISLGENDNESREPGKSSTINPKTHQLKLPGGDVLNFIDTPGLGDTKGIESDYKNLEKILEYISELEELSAICILLKPNNSRVSIIFDYCIKTVIGQLDKGIRKNVVFVFTNARSSFYTPGDTQGPLRKLLSEADPENINPIPFNQFNTFCFENDWFRYLVAKKNGITFENNEIRSFEDSWNKSLATAKRMIDYIKALPQRKIKGMLSVNEAKRLIRKLNSPITILLASHRKARKQLKRQQQILEELTDNKRKLEQNLEMDITKTAKQTTKIRTVENTSRTRVGVGISLGGIGLEVKPENQKGYFDKKDEKDVILTYKGEDPNVKKALNENESEIEIKQKEHRQIKAKIQSYEREFQELITASAQFYVFLKNNVPFYSNDETEVYFKKMIEESKLNDDNDHKMYKDILKKYQTKKIGTDIVDFEEIHKTVDRILNLENSGKELKRILGIEDVDVSE